MVMKRPDSEICSNKDLIVHKQMMILTKEGQGQGTAQTTLWRNRNARRSFESDPTIPVHSWCEESCMLGIENQVCQEDEKTFRLRNLIAKRGFRMRLNIVHKGFNMLKGTWPLHSLFVIGHLLLKWSTAHLVAESGRKKDMWRWLPWDL